MDNQKGNMQHPFEELQESGGQQYQQVDIAREERYGAGDKGTRRLIAAFLSIMLVALSFLGGVIFSEVTLSEEAKLARWIYEQVSQNSYYASKSGLSEKQLREVIMTYGVQGLSVLGDDYASLLTPEQTEQFRQEITQNQSKGIGITMVPFSDNPSADWWGFGLSYGRGVAVMDVTVGSPADIAGIKRYYKLRGLKWEYEGESADITWDDNHVPGSADSRSLQQIISQDISAVPQDAEFTLLLAVPEQYGGGMRYSDGNVEEFTVKRDYFAHKHTRYYTASPDLAAAGIDLDPYTAIVQFGSFEDFNMDTQVAGEAFASAMRRMKDEGKTKLILDLRYNRGGYVAEAVVVASYLVPGEAGEEVLLGYDEYAGEKFAPFYTAPSEYAAMGFEDVVVMVNGLSASASELVLMAMQYYDTDLKILGKPTFGKGIKQDYFFQNNLTVSGYGLVMTVSKLLRPDGETSLHGTGIVPQHIHDDAIADGFTGDTAIAAAVGLLS